MGRKALVLSAKLPRLCCAPHLKLLPLWHTRAGGINRGATYHTLHSFSPNIEHTLFGC
jgi:hypothetical protein